MNNYISIRKFVKTTSVMMMASSIFPSLAATPNRNTDIAYMMIINGLGGLANENLWLREQAKQRESMSASAIQRMRNIDARAIRDIRASGTTAIFPLRSFCQEIH